MIKARNSDEFNIKKEEVLLYINQEQIIQRYIGFRIDYKKNYKNPFRIDENSGCRFYVTKDGKILFNDFSKGLQYDCFDVARLHLKIDNFQKLLNQIAKDFNLYSLIDGNRKKGVLTNAFLLQGKETKLSLEQISSKAYIQVKIREYKKADIDYWKQFNISYEVLEYFKVKCLYYYWINGEHYYTYSAKDPAYLYIFPDETMKIYHPLRSKDKSRFIGNSSAIQGYEYLTQGENLIITKSYKDVMSFFSFGIDACAEQSESVIISETDYSDLYNRYDNIWINKDYDNAGFISARQYKKKFFNNNIMFVRDREAKDFSGLIKLQGIEAGKEWLQKYNLI